MKAKLDGTGVETLASGMDKVSYPAGPFFFQVFFNAVDAVRLYRCTVTIMSV